MSSRPQSPSTATPRASKRPLYESIRDPSELHGATAASSTEELWPRIKQAFAEAVALKGAEREARLSELRQGSPAVWRQVRALLDADDEGSSLGLTTLASDALGEIDRRPEDGIDVGSVLGAYRLTELLGRGGMGSVFKAERKDGQFSQVVAVKVMHRHLSSPQMRERFLEERRILASLTHPGIARLYDGGMTEDGSPYLVMEWVPGQTFDRYCDDHRLSIRARLGLFVEVCRAVEHAHGKLIVHRDLKASNIMVDESGKVRLLDFGIAKLLDGPAEEPVSRHGAAPLTPASAAPEQFLGLPVTTATDVYSLGALLYRTLCGKSPFRARSPRLFDNLQAVLEEQVEAPSARVDDDGEDGSHDAAQLRGTTPGRLRRTLTGDLNHIVLRAVEKDPDRRYASAVELRLDLERHLSDFPIEARSGRFYRFGRFVRRWRWGLVATLVSLLSLGSAFLLTWSSLQETRRAKDESDVMIEFLVDTFRLEVGDEGFGDQVRGVELLERAAGRIEEDLAGRPRVEARVMAALGTGLRDLGRHEVGRRWLEKALVTTEAAFGPDSEQTAEVAVQLGHARVMDAEPASSLELWDRAARIYDALGSEFDHRNSLVFNGMALAAERQGDFGDATRLLEMAVLKDMLRPGAPDAKTAALYVNAGISRNGAKRYAEAIELLDKALDLQVMPNGNLHPNAVSTLVARSMARFRLDDMDRAMDDATAAEEVRRLHYGPTHHHFAQVKNQLGVLLFAQGEHRAAAEEFSAALECVREGLPRHHPWRRSGFLNTIAAYREGGMRTEECALQEVALKDMPADMWRMERSYLLHRSAMCFEEQGRLKEAEQRFKDALEIRLEIFEPEHQKIGNTRRALDAVRAKIAAAGRAP